MSFLCKITNQNPGQGLEIFTDHNVNCRRLHVDKIFAENENTNESTKGLQETVHPFIRNNNEHRHLQPSNADNE